MTAIEIVSARKTAVDVVFDYLHNAIVTLEKLPGDKISETEIASLFGISRQPVRDAFSRLQNLNLLVIRPQKATEVKRFSLRDIAKSRFVRASIEAEVLRRAAKIATSADFAALDALLAKQMKVVARDDIKAFGKLDLEFHALLCRVAKVEYAFDVVSLEKTGLDRLCKLDLSKKDRMGQVLDEHQAIIAAIQAGDAEAAVDASNIHLSSIQATIDEIFKRNPNYFEA